MRLEQQQTNCVIDFRQVQRQQRIVGIDRWVSADIRHCILPQSLRKTTGTDWPLSGCRLPSKLHWNVSITYVCGFRLFYTTVLLSIHTASNVSSSLMLLPVHSFLHQHTCCRTTWFCNTTDFYTRPTVRCIRLRYDAIAVLLCCVI